MTIKGDNIVDFYAFEEDEKYMYFIFEYCNGGSISSYQMYKQPNNVFDLSSAKLILTQVIKGLELLHQKGYLHRNIAA